MVTANASNDTRRKENKSLYKVEIKICMFDVFLCNVKVSSLVLVRIVYVHVKKERVRMLLKAYGRIRECMRKCIYLTLSVF